MDQETLQELKGELDELLGEFRSCFRSEASREHASVYVQGQLGTLPRKCVEPIALDAGVKPRTLQKFLGAHRWDEAAMRSQVRKIVARDHPDANLIGVIDETSFVALHAQGQGSLHRACHERAAAIGAQPKASAREIGSLQRYGVRTRLGWHNVLSTQELA